MNEFIPPVDEQAADILGDLRAEPDVDVPPDLTAGDIEKAIDPDAPVSVNFKTVLDAIR